MSWRALCEAEVRRVWQGQTDGAHDLGHLARVWAMARRIARELGGADLEVLEVAAFLHDVVNLPKDSAERNRAALLSAQHAVTFLSKNEFPKDKLKNVAHAIEAHSFSAGVQPETIEAQILQDSDRLEALGALGIARCFNVSGQMGAALFDAADPEANGRALDDRAFALDHFESKLLRIAETMHTGPAQRIAAERAEYMRQFRDQLLSEISPER